LLAKPITRTQFLLGKYAGLAATVAINIGFMLAILVLVLWLSGWQVHLAIFQAVTFIFFEALIVMASALLFSTFSSATLSAIMTLGVYIVGHLTADLKVMAEKGHDPIVAQAMAALYYLLPNLELLNVKGQAAAGIPVSLEFFSVTMLYGGLYICLLIAGSCVILDRRSF
jgi:ABC-type transport system involved in multi-copper enzyme maturation permease subunit